MHISANTVPIRNSNKSIKFDENSSINARNHPPIKSILKAKTSFGCSNEELNSSKRSIGYKNRVSMFPDNVMPGIQPDKTQVEVVDNELIEVKIKTAQELEDEENEKRAKVAFKTLANILKKAKEDKHR